MMRAAVRFWRVLHTWLAWPVFRVLAVVVVIGAWMQYARIYMWLERQYDFLQQPLVFAISALPPILLLAIPAIMIWRVKSDMTHWRSALMPRHRASNLIVACFLFFVFFFILFAVPAILQVSLYAGIYQDWDSRYGGNGSFVKSYFRWQCASNLGITLMEMTFIAWLCTWMTFWLAPLLFFVLAILSNYWPALREGRNIIDEAAWLTDRVLVTRFFLLDAFLLAAVAVRLISLRPADKSISADERLPWLSNFLVSARAPAPGSLASAGLFRRARHRRLLGLGRRFTIFVAIYLAAVAGLSPMLTPDRTWIIRNGFFFGAVVIATIASAVIVGLAWPHRWRSLSAVESLRPRDRRDFIDEMGLAML